MGDTKSYSAISANGNPLSIRRSGLRQDGTFGLIDDLALSYDDNQLSSVEEKAAPVLSAATLDLKRGSSDFAYNDNGALTMDGTRGITSIAYDDNGSPAGIQFANGSATDTLTLAFKYFNKDHLGNIREVVAEDGTVEQATDYYPFGPPMSDLSRNSGLQRFKYNGKEFDQMRGLNTYDYGTRQYNPVLARWDRMENADGYGQNKRRHCLEGSQLMLNFALLEGCP